VKRISALMIVILVMCFIVPSAASAAGVLPTGMATVTDYRKTFQAFDYVSGAMVSSGGDFWIADDPTGPLGHNWEAGGNTEGILDMGAVGFNDVSLAPATGYLSQLLVQDGHTYVTSSPIKGRYGKFHVDDIIRPGDRPGITVTQFVITYAYQPDGSRDLTTAVSPTPATQPAVNQPPVTQPPVVTNPGVSGTGSGTIPAGGGLYENYQGSPDIGGDVRMQYWHAQTFTALSDHQVDSVKLLAYRIGYPGTLIVSLRATDYSGHPYGYDLASGTTSGDTLPLSQSGEWREITFYQPVFLTGGARYAIVARAPGGGGGNAVKWLTDTSSPDYTGGNREASGDAGANWQSDFDSDYLFLLIGPASGTNQTGGGGTANGGQSSTWDTGSSGSGQSAGTTSTGWYAGEGGGGSLPPGVWKSWESVSSPWVTLGPDQICVDTTSNGWDMGAKTQRTWGTDVNYVVEFEFKTNKDSISGVRIWQDGFAFVVLSWGNTVVLYSGNYDSHEQTKTQLAANRWYRMKIVVTKDADTRFGKYDLYVDGQYVGTMHSSEFDMIRECGGNCILIGKFSESILDRVGLCWRNIYVTFGPGGASATGGATTGATDTTGTGSTQGTVTNTGMSTSQGTGPGAGTTTTAGARLVAESRTASPGDTVLLPVKLENAQGIGSLGYSVQYDPLVIEYVKADKGSIFSDDTSFVTNVPQPGTIIIAYATSGAVSGSGTAAQLEFKAIGPQGSQSAVTLSDITATGSAGGQVAIDTLSGQVIIAQKTKGDGDGDGRVTVLDALVALKMYVKAMPENLVLDVNNDSKVTPEDARQILKMAKPK